MIWEALSDVLGRLEAGTPPPPSAGVFGASVHPSDCALVLIPVPWDTTVSYGAGTAMGPDAITTASHQLDLEDPCFDRPYRCGITMLPADQEILDLNGRARGHALKVIEAVSAVAADDPNLAAVNAASAAVNNRVEALAEEQLGAGRLVGIVGGDHSSPYGLLRALGRKHAKDGFGILHFDAHFDLRRAYEGFTHSHASIMYNVMETIPAVSMLAQVGIRDFSGEEAAYARRLGRRGAQFTGAALFRRKAKGDNWDRVTREILAQLPQNVYVSFDIDGLDAAFCPGTGTPVPGGLTYDEALYLVEELAASGRTIVGFDLCEVAPGEDEWDANVGARVLYKLCGAALNSNGKCGLIARSLVAGAKLSRVNVPP
jgi:agmatinase